MIHDDGYFRELDVLKAKLEDLFDDMSKLNMRNPNLHRSNTRVK